jgi:hypothetical protein
MPPGLLSFWPVRPPSGLAGKRSTLAASEFFSEQFSVHGLRLCRATFTIDSIILIKMLLPSARSRE